LILLGFVPKFSKKFLKFFAFCVTSRDIFVIFGREFCTDAMKFEMKICDFAKFGRENKRRQIANLRRERTIARAVSATA